MAGALVLDGALDRGGDGPRRDDAGTGGKPHTATDSSWVTRREAAAPNDPWQVDHTQLDLPILDAAGKPARPWLTVVLDDHSGAVAGYPVFLGAPSAVQTALALRQAIWRKADPTWPVCGLPAAHDSDHGTDFTSGYIAQVCADTVLRPCRLGVTPRLWPCGASCAVGTPLRCGHTTQPAVAGPLVSGNPVDTAARRWHRGTPVAAHSRPSPGTSSHWSPN